LYPLQFQGGSTSGRPVVKTIAESLSQHDENMIYRHRPKKKVKERK
jgi:hypothetical protein